MDATESADSDGDGVGNNADSGDDDNDGITDQQDAFPWMLLSQQIRTAMV